MLRSFLEILAPLSCPCCHALTDGPCRGCVETWQSAPTLAIPRGLAECRSVFAYAQGVESVVLAMKRTRCHGLARWMAREMASAGAAMGAADVITWAPTTALRVRARGFDHGEELARSVARELGVRAQPLLHRTCASASNASASERSRVTFELSRRGSQFIVDGQRILVIDDVRTTGSTLAAAAAAIHSLHRLSTVCALTFAATAAHRRR